ncbi:MAG: IS200/IS605 family element transposase accessory protein TnpB [Candidatus Verstraetearchaeota archaeon]|nr:IS200/IS605 family element transposase accessory protein TnpB [Candidatus Verstraetearchaeota archaeon]
MLSYRFRLYPSKAVEAELLRHLELCRWLYNRLLGELNRARAEGRRLSPKDTQALIVRLKSENPGLKLVYSKVLQMVSHQLWSNIKALAELKKKGKKVGRLRFKGRWFKTLNYNQSGFGLEGKKLVLSKVGAINIKLHRPINGKVKGVIIKRENSGKWFAIFQVEDGVEDKPDPLPKTWRAIGIDLGTNYLLTDSDGRQIENARFYERTLDKIRVLHKDLSRKKKGSKNREKARTKLARAYEKLTNQRDNFLHKLSRFYVNNHDLICVEGLPIGNMVKNSYLGKKILDASWGKFLQMLDYKAEKAGRRLERVDPKGTSKGLTYEDPYRDYISACRILHSGLGQPSEPVEMEPLRGLTYIPASSIIEAGSPTR